MNSNKKINLLVDAVKLALIIFIACALVSLIVLLVSDDPMTAITSFFIGPFTSLRRIGNIIEAAAPLMFTALAVIIIFGSGQFSMIPLNLIGKTGGFFLYRNLRSHDHCDRLQASGRHSSGCGYFICRLLRRTGIPGTGCAEDEMECQ